MKEKWMNYAGKAFTIYFLITGAIYTISIIFIYFGDLLLKLANLQWRNWVNMTLLISIIGSFLLLLTGIAVMLIVKTKGNWKVRLPAAVISGLLVIGIFFMSWYSLFIIAFANSPEEVTLWNGQRCVTSDTIWFHTSRDWYKYHGYFVMGRESLYSEIIN